MMSSAAKLAYEVRIGIRMLQRQGKECPNGLIAALVVGDAAAGNFDATSLLSSIAIYLVLVRVEYVAAGDSEEQGIADLAGSSDGDALRRSGHSLPPVTSVLHGSYLDFMVTTSPARLNGLDAGLLCTLNGESRQQGHDGEQCVCSTVPVTLAVA
jgi:hypothetical protein